MASKLCVCLCQPNLGPFMPHFHCGVQHWSMRFGMLFGFHCKSWPCNDPQLLHSWASFSCTAGPYDNGTVKLGRSCWRHTNWETEKCYCLRQPPDVLFVWFYPGLPCESPTHDGKAHLNTPDHKTVYRTSPDHAVPLSGNKASYNMLEHAESQPLWISVSVQHANCILCLNRLKKTAADCFLTFRFPLCHSALTVYSRQSHFKRGILYLINSRKSTNPFLKPWHWLKWERLCLH